MLIKFEDDGDEWVKDVPLNEMFSEGLIDGRFHVRLKKDGSRGVEITGKEAKELNLPGSKPNPLLEWLETRE